MPVCYAESFLLVCSFADGSDDCASPKRPAPSLHAPLSLSVLPMRAPQQLQPHSSTSGVTSYLSSTRSAFDKRTFRQSQKGHTSMRETNHATAGKSWQPAGCKAEIQHVASLPAFKHAGPDSV